MNFGFDIQTFMKAQHTAYSYDVYVLDLLKSIRNKLTKGWKQKQVCRQNGYNGSICNIKFLATGAKHPSSERFPMKSIKKSYDFCVPHALDQYDSASIQTPKSAC